MVRMDVAKRATNPPHTAKLDRRRVQLWFGDTVINSYTATAPEARRFVSMMGRRFGGITITVDGQVRSSDRPLPQALEWEWTVR